MALLTRDHQGLHHIGLRGVNVHVNNDSFVVSSFKQALHLSVAIAEDHDVVGIDEVGHMDVGSNLSPWVIL